MWIHLYSTRSECVQLFRAMTSLYGSLNSSSAFGLSARLGWVHIRRLVGSTNQIYSSGFCFRIAWKSTEWPCFLQNHSLSFLWGLRSLKNWLLWKLSIKSLFLLYTLSVLRISVHSCFLSFNSWKYELAIFFLKW